MSSTEDSKAKNCRTIPRAMGEKFKTKLGTTFPSPVTPTRRTTMPPTAGSPSPDRWPPNVRNSLLSSSHSTTICSSPTPPRSPDKISALPSCPQPTHPCLFPKPSTPLPSKMRHNSYPTQRTTSSPSIGLRSKPSSRPTIFMSRNERIEREKRIATAESEACKADLLRHGIKIRDFQHEADGRSACLKSEAMLRRRPEALKTEADRDVAKKSTVQNSDRGVPKVVAQGRPDVVASQSDCDSVGSNEGESTGGDDDEILFEGRGGRCA